MGPKNSVPDTEWECKAGHPGLLVVGVDEVGRGCLAGPVVAAAVILPPEAVSRSIFKSLPWLKQINDSKLLDSDERERLAPLIRSWVRAHAIGIASVKEIDEINIHHASHLAMVRAISALNLIPDHVLVDGKFVPKSIRCGSTAIIKGDQKCLSIACASILAKVWRDQHMVDLDVQYPGYGLAVHKGYPTPQHSRALGLYGASDIHRTTFAPVAEALARAVHSPRA